MIVPPQIAFITSYCPLLEAKAPEATAMTRKIIATTKAKIPYGIAKHGFLNLPVAHPRIAIRIPITPTAMLPFPIPSPASNPGILNYFAWSSVIGNLPDCIAPKIIIISAINPIRMETPITITEHFCLYESL